MYKHDFMLSDGTYLLNHSVGRPLKQAQHAFNEAFFAPWGQSNQEPWGEWLTIIDEFRGALGQLFNAPANEFCPQVNLSSALTKLVMSLERLQKHQPIVLMSEIDFPSMGFVLQQALPANSELRLIPADADITDANVWASYLARDVDMVFISNSYSNTGQRAPVAEILSLTAVQGTLSVVDVAQSAGVIPLDLAQQRPDFVIGSSVKWLCGGPGAAYLWVNPRRLDECHPKDVGWFSHQNPFEFDIHDFRYHDSALRFWGGTPSVTPYTIAAHSIRYFANLGSEAIFQHNQHLIDVVADELADELISPREQSRRSGTMVVNFGQHQPALMTALQQANISVDQRQAGIRISPHLYNDEADIHHLLTTIKCNYRR